MKILLAPLLLAVSLPAFAEVDPAVHETCSRIQNLSGNTIDKKQVAIEYYGPNQKIIINNIIYRPLPGPYYLTADGYIYKQERALHELVLTSINHKHEYRKYQIKCSLKKFFSSA